MNKNDIDVLKSHVSRAKLKKSPQVRLPTNLVESVLAEYENTLRKYHNLLKVNREGGNSGSNSTFDGGQF